MLFVIDIGNSHTVVGLFRDSSLVGQWRFKSDRKATADELAVHYHSLFSMTGIDKNEITGIIIASVVPSLEASWYSWCTAHFSGSLRHPVLVVSEKNVRGIIKIDTDTPQEVGADRLVNAIAAWSQYACDLIVIDFGTAITFDCVTRDCAYIGGAILPGIAISMEALATRTAKLPHIDVSEPPYQIIGKNTIQAMKSGILYGYGSMIDGLVRILGREMTGSETSLPRVIATGGMASLIIPYSAIVEESNPMLTLTGLRIIFKSVYHNG
ncbi:MAG: type III pantothenate kinase [Desulfocapsaceae bacterium]|nr:type III pantothenate kinase [Desulfocapsaceae bacterium]